MLKTAKLLEQRASSAGAAAIEMKLKDTSRLHSFLSEEITNYSDLLKDKIKKRETLSARMQDLTSWIHSTEGKLEAIKENENVDEKCLGGIKVNYTSSPMTG